MADRAKVIKGLECCMADKICSSKCPYKGQCDDGGYYYSRAIEEAIELLKAQEPRVLTLDEVKASTGKDLILEYSPWECVDSIVTAATIEGCGSKGMSFVASVACDYTAYNRKHSLGWRCWSARPTDEQRKAVKWDG